MLRQNSLQMRRNDTLFYNYSSRKIRLSDLCYFIPKPVYVCALVSTFVRMSYIYNLHMHNVYINAQCMCVYTHIYTSYVCIYMYEENMYMLFVCIYNSVHVCIQRYIYVLFSSAPARQLQHTRKRNRFYFAGFVLFCWQLNGSSSGVNCFVLGLLRSEMNRFSDTHRQHTHSWAACGLDCIVSLSEEQSKWILWALNTNNT